MQYPKLVTACALFAILGLSTVALGDDWAVTGDWAESCSCQVGCPCNFGAPPTLGRCEGSALFEIEEGHYGDVNVDGLDVVIAYRFGEWLRVYVDDEATDKQMEAVVKLLNQEHTFGEFFSGKTKLLSIEKADITIHKSDSRISFSVPEATVELEAMTGAGGKPIQILNLSSPFFANGYTQYKALTTSHTRGDVDFAYSGTNGATSHIEASGTVSAE